MVTIEILILCAAFLLVASVWIPFKKKHSEQKPGDPYRPPNSQRLDLAVISDDHRNTLS